MVLRYVASGSGNTALTVLLAVSCSATFAFPLNNGSFAQDPLQSTGIAFNDYGSNPMFTVPYAPDGINRFSLFQAATDLPSNVSMPFTSVNASNPPSIGYTTIYLSKVSGEYTDSSAQGSFFNFSQLEASVTRLRAKYSLGFKNYQMNTGMQHPLTTRQSSGMDKRGYTDVQLIDRNNDELWTGSISFGTPSQVYQVDFDTGSADTWFNPHSYNPSQSSTSEDTNTQFNASYGDGSSGTGEVYYDSFTIGSLHGRKQSVGVASNSDVVIPAGQGISGMAWPSISSFEVGKPWFNTLISQKKLSSAQFGFLLSKNSSTLDIGHLDDSKYLGSIYWSKIANFAEYDSEVPSFWYTKGNVLGGTYASGKVGMIFDTGTTLIYGPSNSVYALFQGLIGVEIQSRDDGTVYGLYVCSQPPSISFRLGGNSFVLAASTLSIGVDERSNKCVLGIIGANVISDVDWLVGDVFLRNVYAAFDVANTRIGFAVRNSPPS